jgi:antitoxin component HigA of HigAB toxin-antitoxin module
MLPNLLPTWHRVTYSDRMAGRPTTSASNVARIVRTLLVHQGRQQVDLATHMGVTPSVVSKALTGKRTWSLDDLVVMAEFFEVSPALFFEDPESLVRNRCLPALQSAA